MTADSFRGDNTSCMATE